MRPGWRLFWNKLLRAFFEGHADGAILGKSNLWGAGEILQLSDWNSWRRDFGVLPKKTTRRLQLVCREHVGRNELYICLFDIMHTIVWFVWYHAYYMIEVDRLKSTVNQYSHNVIIQSCECVTSFRVVFWTHSQRSGQEHGCGCDLTCVLFMSMQRIHL